MGFFSSVPVRTGVDPGRLKHTHAHTHRPQEGEGEKFLLLGPLAHWFDSNCTVTGLQDRKRREMDKLKKKGNPLYHKPSRNTTLVQRF